MYSELVDPVLVDSVAQTVTVNKKVPVAGQEDYDFPEFVMGANDETVTVESLVHLTTMPLTWMLTMTGAWNVDQGNSPTPANASR